MEPPFWRSWYETVENDSLRQGDIFRDLLVYWFPQDLPLVDGDPSPENKPAAEWKRSDWIIVTASCDLEQRRCLQVLLVRVVAATGESFGAQSKDDLQKRQEVVRQGLDPAKFLLAEHPEIDPVFPRSVALYRQQVLLPLDYLKRACKGPRIRMRHPFREQLGMWAGACLSRIGPENDALIPPSAKIFPTHVLKAVGEPGEP